MERFWVDVNGDGVHGKMMSNKFWLMGDDQRADDFEVGNDS